MHRAAWVAVWCTSERMVSCSRIRSGDGRLPLSVTWTWRYACNWKQAQACALSIQAVPQPWPQLSSYGIWSRERAHSLLEPRNSKSHGPIGLSIHSWCATASQSWQKGLVTCLWPLAASYAASLQGVLLWRPVSDEQLLVCYA